MADVESEIVESASGVASRLLAAAALDDQPLSVEPVNKAGWLKVLLARLAVGLRFEPAGAALVIGCAWAFAEAVSRVGRQPAGPLDLRRVVDLVTSARPATTQDGEWSGYVPISAGWISLALSAADRDLWHRFIATPATQETVDSNEVARLAQMWGLACLPVTDASTSALSTSGCQSPPAVGRPGQALGLSAAAVLRGLRVLDLGVLVAAPFACSALSALGASVTAVVHPTRKQSRWYGPPPRELDMNRPEDRLEFVKLCRNVDLVVDNFSPRVWQNFGLEPLEMGARLHLSLPAFPSGDARRHYRAYGFQTEALFGVGCAPDERLRAPIRAPRAALMDHAVGLAGALQCLGALLGDRSGRLEVSHAVVAGLVR